MPDLLDRIRDEIRQRLDACREAVDEYQRLEAALAALGDRASVGSGRGRRRAGGGAVKRAGAAGERRRSGNGLRARRGANREAVLRVVGERPGISRAELAAASGVEQRTLSTLLSTLVKQERLERVALPGGQTGYRIREHDAADSGSGSGSTGPAATGGDTSGRRLRWSRSDGENRLIPNVGAAGGSHCMTAISSRPSEQQAALR